MKIAIVSTDYPPLLGGVGAHVAAVAGALASMGHDVEVLTQASWVDRPTVEEGAVTVRRWPVVSPASYLQLSPGLWRFLRRAGRRYDVVHAHSYHSAAPAAAYLAGCRPLIVTPHMHPASSTRLASLLNRPYSQLFARIVRAASAITADSSSEAELVRSRFPDAEPVVIPSGVARGRFSAQSSIERQAGLVLVVSRLVSYKRVDLAIEAMQYLPDAQLVVVGEGPERSNLSNLIACLGLDARVELIGPVHDDKLTELYLRSSLVVSVSRLEAFGLVVIEALAAGARVVASDIPAHRDLKQFDVYGAMSLFDVADGIQGLVDVMGQALCAGGVEGSPIVPTWESVASRYQALYGEIVGGAGSPRFS